MARGALGVSRAARRRRGGGFVPPPVGATFAMTQLAAANRIYQRTTSTGGGQGKGQGAIPVTLNVTAAGTIFARCRSAADGTTIVQAPWLAVASAPVANGSVTIPGVDARLGWFYLDLSGDGVTWTNGTVAVGMGRLIAMSGQSLMVRMFAKVSDGATSLAGLGISVPANGRILASWTEAAPSTNIASTWLPVTDAGISAGVVNSAGAAELLNLQIAASGVNCGLIGHSVGASAIASWQSGQANGNELLRVLGLAGGAFESFFWFQGHSDTGSSYTTYRSQLDTLFTTLTAASSRSFTKYLTAIPNINSVAWGNTATRSMVRKAQQDWCAENGATYLGFSDIELYTDIVHQIQTGARRVARHLHRAMRSEFGLPGNDRGPLVTGVTRSGLDLTLAVNIPANASSLVSVGSPGTRFLVTKAGDPATAPLALDGATPITVGATSIALKLAADPGNIPLEVWPMGNHPGVADGSLDGVYDNANADGDGISVGRQMFASPAPVRLKVNTPLTSVSAVYGAAKFGNGRTGGRLDSPYAGILGAAFNGMTVDFWVRINSLPGGNQVFLGQNDSYFIGINSSGGLIHQIGTAAMRTLAGVFAVGNTYHIRVILLPGGQADMVFVNGVLVDTYTGGGGTSNTSVFAIGDRGGGTGFSFTAGWVDEVAIFNTVLGTSTFTPPVAEWTGSESNLLHLWHLNESSGNATDSTV